MDTAVWPEKLNKEKTAIEAGTVKTSGFHHQTSKT